MTAQTFISLRGLLAASSAKIGSSACWRMMEPVGRVGAAAGPGAGAWRTAWHGLPGWQQHPGAPESGRRCSKGGDGTRRPASEALGRSHGGYGTKACVIADAFGRAVTFSLAPGQAHELPQAIGLLECLPGVPRWVVADRGTTSHAFRGHIWNHRPSARRLIRFPRSGGQETTEGQPSGDPAPAARGARRLPRLDLQQP